MSPVAKSDAITSCFSSVYSAKPNIRATYQSAPLLLLGSGQTAKQNSLPRAVVEAIRKGELNGLANATVFGGRRAGPGRVHFSRTPGRVNLLDGNQEQTGRKQLGERVVESAQLCNFTVNMFRLGLRKVKA